MSSLVGSTWNLLKRNRGKLLVAGAAVGGFVALNRYLSSWQKQWQHSSSRDFVSEVKKKEIHFENTLDTCNSTSMALSAKIVDILDASLDAETILDQIKSSEELGSDSRVKLWTKLKVRIFARVVAEVYCLVFFVAYLRVQLSILAGYIYVDNCALNGVQAAIMANTSNVQNKYLSLLHHFYSDGIQLIIEPVLSAVESAMKDIALKDNISLQDLNAVFERVKASMAFTFCGPNSNASKFLLTSDKLFTSENGHTMVNGRDAELLQCMLSETEDILESSDFKRVIESGVDMGFSIVMDMILGCFVRVDHEKSSGSQDNGFTNPHSIRVPLAKLLPKIWLSLQERKKRDEKCVLVRHLICLDVLNCFAANIYEAFCNDENDKLKNK